MRDYTAIGTMFTNNTTPEFVTGILGGLSRSLRAGNNNTCVVFAREIDNEIHIGLQQEQSFGGGRIVKHHLNNVCNAICCSRRENTMIYVFEATEMVGVRDDDLHTHVTAGELSDAEQERSIEPLPTQPRTD